MKRTRMLLVMTVVLSVVTVTIAVAQQPMQQHGAGHQSPGTAPQPGMQGHDARHAQHMEMCRQMMGQGGMMGGAMGPGMMGGGMMGMMPMMMGGDPKQQADMMAMRGEMMKAMGDIMLKYAQRAQSK
jgi:hypothetical protein